MPNALDALGYKYRACICGNANARSALTRSRCEEFRVHPPAWSVLLITDINLLEAVGALVETSFHLGVSNIIPARPMTATARETRVEELNLRPDTLNADDQ